MEDLVWKWVRGRKGKEMCEIRGKKIQKKNAWKLCVCVFCDYREISKEGMETKETQKDLLTGYHETLNTRLKAC